MRLWDVLEGKLVYTLSIEDGVTKMWELTAPRGMLPGTGVKGGKCVRTFEGHKVSDSLSSAVVLSVVLTSSRTLF